MTAITPPTYRVALLTPGDGAVARRLFSMMADVFEEEHSELSDAYVDRLLASDALRIVAAFSGDEVVGGLTAHLLPMTRIETREVFIYDIAVRSAHQRCGVGRQLMAHLRQVALDAGASVLFVAADNDDPHALEFYRAIGGAAAPVTFFTFDQTSAPRR